MSRRTTTLVAAVMLAAALGVLGATVPVPMVALGPGPTYDTLGEVDGKPVITIDGLETYPTAGHLNMTTVGVTDRLTLVRVLGYWASGERQVVPRDRVFPPEKSDEQVQRENTEQFATSEINAQVAAIEELGLPTRVVVDELVPESPAAGTLEVGDELVTVSGRPVDSPGAVVDALAGTAPGERVSITFRRDEVLHEADVVLGENPDRPQGMLGVRPALEPAQGEITIQLGDVGGPSAGLMFALAVVDKLTPGELTGGRFVAGTGSITAEGEVQPIGGIPFKMHAARTAGAEVFLVPEQNCAEAMDHAPDGLRLVRVSTLDQAVDALEALRTGSPSPAC